MGLEIRADIVNSKLLELSNSILELPKEFQKNNLHYMVCNFAVSATQLLRSISRKCLPPPPENKPVSNSWIQNGGKVQCYQHCSELDDTVTKSPVRLVSIQFPDPWRRTKHLKRLIVQ